MEKGFAKMKQAVVMRKKTNKVDNLTFRKGFSNIAKKGFCDGFPKSSLFDTFLAELQQVPNKTLFE